MQRIGPFVALGFALLVALPLAHGQVYRCKDVNGGTTYSDAPCAPGGKSLKIPQGGSPGFGDTTVCAQLLDETRRLAAQARRAARNETRRADASKRRQALVAQYERRCASIHRSTR